MVGEEEAGEGEEVVDMHGEVLLWQRWYKMRLRSHLILGVAMIVDVDVDVLRWTWYLCLSL